MPVARLLLKFVSAVLDVVAPPRCALCAELGDENPCKLCRAAMPAVPIQMIPHPAVDFLDYHFVGFEYTSRSAQMIRRLKYERATSLSAAVADMTRDCIEKSGVLDDVDWIVPVPIHWRRRAWRGFNQSEILCERLPKKLLAPETMFRTRYTRPQVGLPLNERLVNLANSFAAHSDLGGARILLVDDVYTSGATARECAKALKARGAASVGMFALTRSMD